MMEGHVGCGSGVVGRVCVVCAEERLFGPPLLLPLLLRWWRWGAVGRAGRIQAPLVPAVGPV